MQDATRLPEEVVQALARLLDAGSWAPGIDDLCARWPQLAATIRAEAAAMLTAARAETAQHGETRASLDRIGSFHILSEIGAGGMGTVYLAEQKGPVRRRVALKVIKLGMDTKAVLARFDAERQALALMDHTSIAKVYEAGATPEGRPYFAMEYVRGVPITRYCDDNRLSVEERLGLFRQVCAGVQHAHTKGVVHRDLTPNNVLVTVQDSRPVAKIIDFGLARATDHRLTEKTVFTERGVMMGTPEYMSPEQAGLDALDIDMRTDVYTLGVLLYELLTGTLPFSSKQLRQAGFDKMCDIIRTQEPERPSTKITTGARDTEALAKLRRTDADKLLRRLRGDLDWVVLKCLEKDRTRRYETVNELAADVLRHLEHEPVLAHAPSLRYRLAKLARRHRAQLLAATAVLLALIAGLTGTTWFALEARAETARANRQASTAESARAAEARKTKEAAENAAMAERNAAAAMARKSEFDQLAGVVLLERTRAAERLLYPPWPANVAAMQRWLEQDVGRLRTIQTEIERTLQTLRARALPATSEEIERDKTSHPRYEEWLILSSRLAALLRARAVRAGNDLALPPASTLEQAMTPQQLYDLAWPRVAPEDSRRIWGEEPRGLTLARLAWDKSAVDGKGRVTLAHALAWAWFANGKDHEALAQSEAALALAADEERETYSRRLAALQASVAAAAGAAGDRMLANVRQRVDDLGAIIDTRRSYRIDDASQSFLHDTLADLHGKLIALEANEYPAVQARLAWAQGITGLTDAHPLARTTWEEARAAIAKADDVVASSLYQPQPIALTPQMGLVPIGMNPLTKLWEFYELRSAWDGKIDPAAILIPRHVDAGDRPGHIEVSDDTGIVFVLLPGGTFTMGAQCAVDDAANYDPRAEDDENPPHPVTLAAFFLARHELTRGQWKRLSGSADPSWYRNVQQQGNPQPITDSHPVDSVDWRMCDDLLRRHGLLLPTEAQWEYGCRAGTTSPWWTGNQPATLGGAANLMDRHAAANYPTWGTQEGDFDDGWCSHAPVGTYRPNGFGLFDMHGNVWEWCADYYGDYSLPLRVGDGLRQVPKNAASHYGPRGGSFTDPARYARSSMRTRNTPATRNAHLGLRAARALRP